MNVAEDLDKYRAPALDKGLDILELLAGTEEGLSQAEIAKALDRSPNEIYRMLDRLVRRDYGRRTSADRYELTLKLFELAHASPPIRRLVPVSWKHCVRPSSHGWRQSIPTTTSRCAGWQDSPICLRRAVR